MAGIRPYLEKIKNIAETTGNLSRFLQTMSTTFEHKYLYAMD